ncbi:hypothetical protein EON80_28005 [bacterium]|nr:MAG: hypothetical protein EON80_28005 [bacterium]
MFADVLRLLVDKETNLIRCPASSIERIEAAIGLHAAKWTGCSLALVLFSNASQTVWAGWVRKAHRTCPHFQKVRIAVATAVNLGTGGRVDTQDGVLSDQSVSLCEAQTAIGSQRGEGISPQRSLIGTALEDCHQPRNTSGYGSDSKTGCTADDSGSNRSRSGKSPA